MKEVTCLLCKVDDATGEQNPNVVLYKGLTGIVDAWQSNMLH
jgi:hypothetical protein